MIHIRFKNYFKRRLCFPAILIAAALMVGCNPHYVANKPNVPLLREKNEFRTTVTPANLQLAFSPVQGLGIMANGFFREQSGLETINDLKTERYRQTQWLAEGGIGHYRPVTRDSLWFFSIYGGYGHGKAIVNIEEENYDNFSGAVIYTKRDFDANESKIFVQPSLGLSRNNFEMAMSVRFSSLAFTNAKLENFTPAALAKYGFRDIEKRRYILAQPAITVLGGWERVKIETQIGYTYRLNHAPRFGERSFVGSLFFLNLGLHVVLAPRQN